LRGTRPTLGKADPISKKNKKVAIDFSSLPQACSISFRMASFQSENLPVWQPLHPLKAALIPNLFFRPAVSGT